MNAAHPSSPQEASTIASFSDARVPFRLPSGRAPSWQSQIALLIATLLGIGLVIILSPVLILIGFWLAGAAVVKTFSRLQRRPAHVWNETRE